MLKTITVLALIAGCEGFRPAKLQLDSPESVTVHTLDPVELPAGNLVLESGQVLDEHPTLNWQVSPNEVARLSEDSRTIVPLAPGTAHATASAYGLTDSLAIVVALPDEVRVDTTALDSLLVGEQSVLQARLYLDGAEVPIDPVGLSWTSSDPSVASVDGDVITAIAEGKTDLSVSTQAGLKATSTVVVGPSQVAMATDPDAAAPGQGPVENP